MTTRFALFLMQPDQLQMFYGKDNQLQISEEINYEIIENRNQIIRISFAHFLT